MWSSCLAKSLYWSEAAEPIGGKNAFLPQKTSKTKRLTFRPPGAFLAAGGFDRSWLLWRSPLCSFGRWPDTSVPAASPSFPSSPQSLSGCWESRASRQRHILRDRCQTGAASLRMDFHSVMWWRSPLLFFFTWPLFLLLGSCYSSVHCRALCEHLGVGYLAQGYLGALKVFWHLPLLPKPGLKWVPYSLKHCRISSSKPEVSRDHMI